jgi:hypothetical protein
MTRGHTLLADDITILDPSGGELVAFPGPPLMTVPERSDRFREGDVIMELPGERWVAAAVADDAAPLQAIIELDRQLGAKTGLHTCRDPFRALLGGGMLQLPRTAERAVTRFDLASRLTAECAILTLTADSRTPPSELAELVERAVGG